ncbi:MAG: hypothetical protein ABL952_07550 [Pyrinomonadaceae bacterium]
MPKSTSKNWETFRVNSTDKQRSGTIGAEPSDMRVSPKMKGVHLPLFYSETDENWKGIKMDEDNRRNKVQSVVLLLEKDPPSNRRQRLLRNWLWRVAKFSSKQERVPAEDIIKGWTSSGVPGNAGGMNSRRLRMFADQIETLFRCTLTEQEAQKSFLIVAKRLLDDTNERK